MKKNRSRRSFSSKSAEVSSQIIRVRSVHLRKDQLAQDLIKEKIRHVVELNETKHSVQITSDEEEDKMRATDLTILRLEAPEQIVREGREAITDGTPTGNWAKYNFARSRIMDPATERDYYDCFKQFERTQQLVDSLKIVPNLYVNMLTDTQSNNLFPKSLGIPKSTNIRANLNVRRQLLGQGKYSNLVSIALQNLPSTQVLDLADNNLTSEQLSSILLEVKEGIQRIDLSNNNISREINLNLNFSRSLKSLILANTYLNDDGLKIISQKINRSLRVLNLSHNQLTDNCCRYLPVGENDYVQELYLNWNKLQGRGGQQIFKTLLENTTLKVLDLSQNALGHPEHLCFSSLHTILILPHPDLVHLDLSHNQFSQQDCFSISLSLKGNQQLYGLHLIGNKEWYVDPEGWAVDRSKVQDTATEIQFFDGVQIDIDEINEQLRYMITLQVLEEQLNTIHCQHVNKAIQSTDILGENKYQNKTYDLFDNCWICEGWQDIRFEWIPSVSGELNQEHMYIHLDFLQFKPVQMQYYNNTFVAYKMCPPNREVIYFYSNPSHRQQLVALDQDQIELPEDHPLRRRQHQRPILMYDEKTHFRSNHLTHANIKYTTYGEIFNKAQDFMLLVNSQPRGTFRHKDLLEYLMRQNGIWNQQTSIFKNFQGDTDQLLDQCFEHDFDSSRISKLCDDQYQSDIVKETLRPYYRHIFHAYKYYASMSMNLNIPCISLPFFIEMISRTKIMSTGMRPTDIQVLFISSCSKDNTSSNDKREYLVDKCVVRHQFMEMIVRLAVDKYGKRGFNVQDCVSKIFNEDKLLDWLMNGEGSDFGISNATNSQVQQFMNSKAKCMPAIQQLYVYTASLTIKLQTHRTKMVQILDFMELIEKAGLAGCLTQREMMNIYFLSIQSQINEINSINHFLMNIIEFMEAIARMAEKISPCREEGRTLKQRRTQTLQRKLFIMLWILYHQMKPQIKHFYIRRNLDYKDYEMRLFRDLIKPKVDAPKPPLQSESRSMSPVKRVVMVSQSLDRMSVKPTQKASIPIKKQPIFNLDQLLGTKDTTLPSLRQKRSRYFKEVPQKVEQYEVMKCLNFFLNNK